MYFANYAARVKISTKRCTRGRVVPFPECARVGRHALPEAPINGGRFAVERGVAGALDVWAHARKWVEIFLCEDNVRTIRYVQGTGVKKVPVPKIDRKAPPNGAFERSWGPKTRDVPKKRTRWSVRF